MDGQAPTPHVPTTEPTAGLWHAPEGAATVWTANGDIMIAVCNSRHLSHAGNVANARYIGRSRHRDSACSDLIAAAEAVINAKSQTAEEVVAISQLVDAVTAAKEALL